VTSTTIAPAQRDPPWRAAPCRFAAAGSSHAAVTVSPPNPFAAAACLAQPSTSSNDAAGRSDASSLHAIACIAPEMDAPVRASRVLPRGAIASAGTALRLHSAPIASGVRGFMRCVMVSWMKRR
jgi:hypothetical protein